MRARIVMLLRVRAASRTELAEALGMAKGTVGHHLKVLERSGLILVVATRRVRAVTAPSRVSPGADGETEHAS